MSLACVEHDYAYVEAAGAETHHHVTSTRTPSRTHEPGRHDDPAWARSKTLPNVYVRRPFSTTTAASSPAPCARRRVSNEPALAGLCNLASSLSVSTTAACSAAVSGSTRLINTSSADQRHAKHHVCTPATATTFGLCNIAHSSGRIGMQCDGRCNISLLDFSRMVGEGSGNRHDVTGCRRVLLLGGKAGGWTESPSPIGRPVCDVTKFLTASAATAAATSPSAFKSSAPREKVINGSSNKSTFESSSAAAAQQNQSLDSAYLAANCHCHAGHRSKPTANEDTGKIATISSTACDQETYGYMDPSCHCSLLNVAADHQCSCTGSRTVSPNSNASTASQLNNNISTSHQSGALPTLSSLRTQQRQQSLPPHPHPPASSYHLSESHTADVILPTLKVQAKGSRSSNKLIQQRDSKVKVKRRMLSVRSLFQCCC